jgi:hypothetical protein
VLQSLHFGKTYFNIEMVVTERNSGLYTITYQNRLKKGRNIDDFQKWLKSFWPVQKAWGAESVHVWCEREGDESLVYCRYRVHDIRLWNLNAMKREAEVLVRELGGIVETNRITIDKTTEPTTGRPNPH